MNFESTVVCIDSLLEAVGTLSISQLKCFFATAEDARNLDYYLQQLEKENRIELDLERGIARAHKAVILKDSVLTDRIKAFWVIANFGCDNIREIFLKEFPVQYGFITHDDKVYDIAICRAKSEAQIVRLRRKNELIEGTEDDVNHIVLVNDEEFGEELEPYGFDSYCILDDSMVPVYHTWNC